MDSNHAFATVAIDEPNSVVRSIAIHVGEYAVAVPQDFFGRCFINIHTADLSSSVIHKVLLTKKRGRRSAYPGEVNCCLRSKLDCQLLSLQHVLVASS